MPSRVKTEKAFFRDAPPGYSKCGVIFGNAAKEARRLFGGARCKANDETNLH
jgi:hypothetical protein